MIILASINLTISTTSFGTTDGQGFVSNNGIETMFELSHPLDTPDDVNDFDLQPGDCVQGWLDGLRLIAEGAGGDYPIGYGDTTFPLGSAVPLNICIA